MGTFGGYTRWAVVFLMVLVQEFTKPQYTVVFRNRINTTYGVLKYFCTRTQRVTAQDMERGTVIDLCRRTPVMQAGVCIHI